ncbi:MAG TPA: hypothetical protein VES19_02590 [Candidatus Limnocylindrales bacterium]|nr:hypothetical protein [Candidatus Limnocylindrales bacterium]
MQHSIVARHAAWPARYVHPTTRARERRLGLAPGPVFTAAPNRRTVLRRPDIGPLTALRAPWRTLVVAPARPVRSGRPKPVATMSWTSSDRDGGPRRPSLAPAWRA